jgi:hypothetical protein
MQNYFCKNVILLALLSFIHGLVKGQTEYIVTVNPVTAAITKIDSIPGVRWLQSYSTYNQSTNEYTVIGTYEPGQTPNHLYTLNAISGNIIASPILSSPNNYVSFEFSRSTGVLYGIIVENGVYYLATISTSTGIYLLIHDIPNIQGGIGRFTIDEANQRLFLSAVDGNPSFTLLTIDLATGNIINHVSTQILAGLVYDNVLHSLYGITYRSGTTPGSYIYSLCKADPTTGSVSVIADLPNITGFISGGETINENDHLYIFEGRQDIPTKLYSVNLNSGSIINNPVISNTPTILNDNLVFFRYDNASGKLYGLLWEVHTIPILPVILTDFDATLREQSVVCKWQTSQEVNSDKFIIERSDDAIEYLAIGSIQAAGDYSSQLNYSFTDLNPFSPGKEYLYYRLKMVDRDGKFSFSNIVKVRLKYESSLSISLNPVNDQLNFNFTSVTREEAKVSIADLTGKMVYEQDLSIQKGSNLFLINTSYLSAGTYILSVSDQRNYSIKFIKAAR